MFPDEYLAMESGLEERKGIKLPRLTLGEILNPLGSESYKVITHQKSLNSVLEKRILPYTEDLREIKVVPMEGTVQLRGVIKEPDALKKFKAGDIYFILTLSKEEITGDEVFLTIRQLKVFNPKKKLDIVKIINSYSNVIQKKILDGLTGGKSPFAMVEPYHSIKFNLNYILEQIPTEVSLLGKVKILNLAFESNRIIWYIHSSLMIKNVINYFGPDYIEFEKVDLNLDALKLLTDLPFINS